MEWLEAYINRFKGTVLTISHDRYFLDQVADRIVEIHEGHGEFYSGNYSFYIEEKQARFDLQMKQYEQEQAKLKQLGFTLEREIEKLEKLLAGLEEQVAAASADYQELSRLLEEKEREDAVLSDLMEQWESAAGLLG